MSLSGIFPYENRSFHTAAALDTLSEEQYDFLIGRRSKHSYKKGEAIFREGTRPSGVFFVHQGKVKKFKKSPIDREQIVYIASKGELIGYQPVIGKNLIHFPGSLSLLPRLFAKQLLQGIEQPMPSKMLMLN
jgi:CRP-like cAMP-binding protein